MTRRSTGPFRAGDSVQLTDPKGRLHTVVLEPGKAFHTHRGAVAHDDLIGAPEGIVVKAQPSGTAVPGAAAAAGRLRAVDAARRRGGLPEGRGPDRGHGRRLPRRPGARGRRRLGRADLLAAARGRRRRPGGQLRARDRTSPRWPGATWSGSSAARTRPGSCATATSAPHPADQPADRVVLDMLAPWEVLDAVAAALVPGGVLVAYVATTTQLSRIVEALREYGGFTEPAAWETPGPALARGRAGGPAGAPDGRAHRVPGVGAPARPGRHRAGPAAPAGQGGRRTSRPRRDNFHDRHPGRPDCRSGDPGARRPTRPDQPRCSGPGAARTHSDVAVSVPTGPVDPRRPRLPGGPSEHPVSARRQPAFRGPTSLTAQGHARPATVGKRIGCGRA